MTESPDQLLEDKSVVPLELLFDVVFVLGITQTVAMIVSAHDGQALLRQFNPNRICLFDRRLRIDRSVAQGTLISTERRVLC